MTVNKNFVVKNGIEVATDLIFASSDLDKVGIGSTIPTATLEVGGDFKATGNSTVVGIATVQDDLVVGTGGTVITADVSAGRIGLNTATPGYNVHVSNVGSGLTTLYVDGGDLKVDGDIYADNIGGLTDINTVNLNVTGIATFGDGTGVDSVDINADVDMDANLHLTGFSTFTQLIDANNGIDASTLKVEDLTDNRIVISGTGGELEDDGNLTFDGTGLVIGGGSHLSVSGVSTLTGNTYVGSAVSIYASSGIVSASYFYGDGSNLSGVTATAGGSLGFSTASAVGYGVTLLNFVGAGVSTLSSPHSGIATLTIVGGSGGSASIGIGSTQGDAGFDSPTAGNLWYNTDEARLFIYYNDGSSSQWVDAAPFNIGIITSGLQSLAQGTALSPSLAFSGDSSTGLFSPTSGQQTFVSVGSSILNVNPGGVEVTGVVTATTFDGNATTATTATNAQGLTGSPNITVNNITGAAVTFNGDLTVNGVLTYEDVTNVDSIGLITARSGLIVSGVGIGLSVTEGGARISGICTATDFDALSDFNLKQNITTVDNALELTDQLRGVRFEWKESGDPSYGVIAQELEKVLPELVSQNEFRTVSYNGIIGVLIEAIKELNEKVRSLENK